MERVEPFFDIGSLARDVGHLASIVQSPGGIALVAFLLVLVLIAASHGGVVPALAALLVSLVSLLLFAAPDSVNMTLGVVSVLGAFLIALQSVIARRRALALNREIAEVTGRVSQLEGAEHRRMLIELKKRPSGDQTDPTLGIGDEDREAPSPGTSNIL